MKTTPPLKKYEPEPNGPEAHLQKFKIRLMRYYALICTVQQDGY